uniref:Uncharacterized protein n=1 Tax=Arundo donax TaxID=35708 RepID=A0A0A9CZ07_ARUDO
MVSYNAMHGVRSPPGPLMYRRIFFVLSMLSRYNMLANTWLLNSSSILSPMKIIRSRYKAFHVSSHCQVPSPGVL